MFTGNHEYGIRNLPFPHQIAECVTTSPLSIITVTSDGLTTVITIIIKFGENQGKYVGIYLISNVSGQTDRLLARVTGPRVKLSASDRRVGGNFERCLHPLTNVPTKYQLLPFPRNSPDKIL